MVQRKDREFSTIRESDSLARRGRKKLWPTSYCTHSQVSFPISVPQPDHNEAGKVLTGIGSVDGCDPLGTSVATATGFGGYCSGVMLEGGFRTY